MEIDCAIRQRGSAAAGGIAPAGSPRALARAPWPFHRPEGHGDLLHALLNLSDWPDHAGDDEDKRDQRRRRDVEHAEAEPAPATPQQRRYGRERDADAGLLPEVIDLPAAPARSGTAGIRR